MGQDVIAAAEVSPTISSRVLFVQDGSLLFLQFVQTELVVQINIFCFLRIFLKVFYELFYLCARGCIGTRIIHSLWKLFLSVLLLAGQATIRSLVVHESNSSWPSGAIFIPYENPSELVQSTNFDNHSIFVQFYCFPINRPLHAVPLKRGTMFWTCLSLCPSVCPTHGHHFSVHFSRRERC